MKPLTPLTWIVWRDRAPLAPPGEQLGVVSAVDRAGAEQAACERHGPRVVVERATATDLRRLEATKIAASVATRVATQPTKGQFGQSGAPEVREAIASRAMSLAEVALARALVRCRFADPTDRAFARMCHAETCKPYPRITDPQAAVLRQLAERCRRQLPRELVALLEAQPSRQFT